jgi:hypothetical protein
MRIQYIEPLSRGISRAKQALFNPMDLRKWLAIGFTAFLAALADMHVSGGVPDASMRKGANFNLEQVLYFPQRAWEWLASHHLWAMLIVAAAFFLFLFMIVITWLSSRGKFMFLDNIVRGEARVVAPWHEYAKEANSFFLWNLSWGIIFSAAMIAYIVFCFVLLQEEYDGSGNGAALIGSAILAGLGFLALFLISAFIYGLLRDFVTQIMYRDRVSGSEAIQKFLPLFFSHFLYFAGFALFNFIVWLLVILGVLICGCVTCCLGFLILAIPYINAVVLLPVTYSMRAFAVEFFEQFGPEYRVFPRPDAGAPETVPPGV